MTDHKSFMQIAIDLARLSIEELNGGPFGAVVVKDGKIVGTGTNGVTKDNDPTAHAEVVAIRNACKKLESFQLEGCIIYSSTEPCPMCLGAIYWARPEKLYFAASREDAADADFDDAFIYDEIGKSVGERSIPTVQIMKDDGMEVFELWQEKVDRIEY